MSVVPVCCTNDDYVSSVGDAIKQCQQRRHHTGVDLGAWIGISPSSRHQPVQLIQKYYGWRFCSCLQKPLIRHTNRVHSMQSWQQCPARATCGTQASARPIDPERLGRLPLCHLRSRDAFIRHTVKMHDMCNFIDLSVRDAIKQRQEGLTPHWHRSGCLNWH